MSSKQLLCGDCAHLAVLRGVTKLAKAVKVTLGPKGRNAVLDRQGKPHAVTKDGVSVAQEIVLADPYENMGAQLIREAASKTGDSAGDGTTTAIVLAEAMVREGVKHLAAGASAPELKRGVDQAVDVVVTELARMNRPCRTRQEIVQTATIAANQDRALGEIIADAVDHLGWEGVLTIDDGPSPSTRLDAVQGLRFDSGYVSPLFVTDPDQRTVTLEQPYLLILDQKLDTLREVLSLLDRIAKQGVPLLIVADDVEGDALALLLLNQRRGVLRVVAVKSPGSGDDRRTFLEDLAVATGGKAFVRESGRTLASASLVDLGRASRITIDRERTTVIGGHGDPTTIAARIKQIKARMTISLDEDRHRLQERLVRLSGRAAVIHVGAATDTELQEKKARIENAVHATQAAMVEGIVPGGGLALFRCAPALDALRLSGDQQIGVSIVRRALEAPLRQIAENAGHAGSIIVGRVAQTAPPVGFDAVTATLVDMFAAGIIDPTKVTRSALTHAASVAGLLLTADVMVTDFVEETWMEPDVDGRSV